MGLLDSIVDRHFAKGPDGQVILRHPAASKRSYLIGSKADESKLRAFFKVFYFGHLSITVLGFLLAGAWSQAINYEWGRPSAHMLRTMVVTACTFALVYGLPELLLWRILRAGLSSFTEGLEETRAPAPPVRVWPAAIALGALAILLAIAVLFLIQAR